MTAPNIPDIPESAARFFQPYYLEELIRRDDLTELIDAIACISENYNGAMRNRMLEKFLSSKHTYAKAQAVRWMSEDALSILDIRSIIDAFDGTGRVKAEVLKHSGWGITRDDLDSLTCGFLPSRTVDMNPARVLTGNAQA